MPRGYSGKTFRVKAAYYRYPKNPVTAAFNIFKDSFIVGTAHRLEDLGKQVTEEVKKRIEDQSFDHVPLTKLYLRWKRRKKLDERILIATGDYVRGIGVRKLKDGTIEVGVKRRKHKPSGLWLSQLARIHEFGTATIPARPHWRPVVSILKRELRQTKKDLRKVMRTKLKGVVKSRYRKLIGDRIR